MNPYYEMNEGKIVLTELGQNTLDFMGLSLDDLKAMSSDDLRATIKGMGDCLNDGNENKGSGVYQRKPRTTQNWMPGTTKAPHKPQYPDSGSYSRYFSLDAWSEKNLPESVKRTFPFFIIPKASKREKNAGLDELDNQMGVFDRRHKTDGLRVSDTCLPTKNTNPCVKPLKLMSYLLSIGSRPGDVILDPFVGSGTTAIAAAILDRRYIGIELSEEFCDIAERRIKWHVKQAEKEGERQPDMFAEAAGD